MISGLTAIAASRICWIRSTHASIERAVVAPMAPLVVSPMCATTTSAPASAMAVACSVSNTYGVVAIPASWAARIMSTSSPKPIPVSSRFCRNCPSHSPTVGKFCTPENPIRLSSSRNTGINRNGSVPQTPAMTGVSRTTGRTSPAISTTIAFASP